MSMTDPIADLLSRIRNAHTAKHDRLDVPASRVKLEICRLLKESGFVQDVQLLEEEGRRAALRIVLRYDGEGRPLIQHLRRVSRPGRRVYRSADEVRPILDGLGVGILSTPQGLLTDRQARERRVGGELLCEIW
jgi:small subunit ribosomal protein S8